MVKAPFKAEDGKPGVILGLSAGNCLKLVDGKPILIDVAEIVKELPGCPMELPELYIVLVGGDTEEAIVEELAGVARQAGARVEYVEPVDSPEGA